ncbi:MAG: hypothetical protein IKH90_03100 [Ruminococcus sp.]|nr:hypothetical protein [Ruminococcus sp.]MBR7007602.1 hypothetical protein [Ruminococcus sp.]
MGLGELVSSLFALNPQSESPRSSKRISFLRNSRRADDSSVISQTTTVSEPLDRKPTVFIDTRMHFAMNTAREIERCVFKLLNESGRFEPSTEYYKARDRYYSDAEIQEIAQSKDHRDIVRYIVDRACGEAYVFVEKNNAGRLRVYAQFRRNEDEAVGQFSSDMPNFTDIANCYKAGDVTFGRIKRDR